MRRVGSIVPTHKYPEALVRIEVHVELARAVRHAVSRLQRHHLAQHIAPHHDVAFVQLHALRHGAHVLHRLLHRHEA